MFGIIQFARQMYESDSDDENEQIEKIQGFSETIVPHMSNRQFKMHFRLQPSTFEDLLVKLQT